MGIISPSFRTMGTTPDERCMSEAFIVSWMAKNFSISGAAGLLSTIVVEGTTRGTEISGLIGGESSLIALNSIWVALSVLTIVISTMPNPTKFNRQLALGFPTSAARVLSGITS